MIKNAGKWKPSRRFNSFYKIILSIMTITLRIAIANDINKINSRNLFNI